MFLSVLLWALGVSTVWDGVYTPAQATRGKAAYDTRCGVCHGAELTGGQALPLVGQKFYDAWGEDSLSSLYEVIRDRMPRSAPRSLTDEMYVDILAYVLQRNDYPSGVQELTPEATQRIQVVGKNGPAPVPNFALVRVVGCLVESKPGAWQLVQAAEPVRTRDPAPSKDGERVRSATTTLGQGTFELMDAYEEPVGKAGQKVEVKGLLMRGKTNKLNFSSLQTLGETCRP